MNMNMNKTNTGKLLAAVMALAMVITCAAVLMSDNGVQAAEAEQGYYGEVNTYQPFPAGTNIVLVDDTEIGEGGIIYVQGNFRVAEGVTLTIKDGGQLVIAGTDGKVPKVTIDGEVIVSGSGTVGALPSGTTIAGFPNGTAPSGVMIEGSSNQITTVPDFKNTGVTINGTISFTSGATFKSIGSTYGAILLADGGNLSIAEKSKKAASINGMTVFVAVGGTFTYAGTTDSTNGVTVSSYGTGTNVTTASVNLKAAATAPAKADHSNLTFTTTSSNINGYAAGSEDPVMFREYALNINGTVSYAETMTLSANAVSTYYASIDAAKHAGDATHTERVVAYNDLVMGKIIIDKLTVDDAAKLTIGVGGKPVYVIVNGTLDVKEITAYDYTEITKGTGTGSKDDMQPDMVKIYTGSVLEIVGTVSVNYEMIEGTVSTAGIIAVNGGTATVADYDETDKVQLYGAFYVDTDNILHLSDLASAIAGAQTAGAEQVSVYAATNSEKCVDGYGGYAITADLTIPDGIELFIGNALVVDEGVTVTFSAESDIGFETGWGKLFVFGTVVDNSLNLADVDAPAENMMYFQVKTVSEDEEVNTYTTLANALETTTSGTIYLYNNVEISGTMIIPENVTVAFSEDALPAPTASPSASISFEDENATLVINGTLSLDANTRLNNNVGTITVNNVIVSEDAITAGIHFVRTNGVYFSADLDNEGTKYYITSAAYAAENSASVSGNMTVYGKVAMGAVTFTKSDDAASLAVVIKNNYATPSGATTVDKNVTTGDITLAGGATFNATEGGFTGTVTDGTNTVNLNKSKGASIGFKTVESTEGTSTDMILTGANILGGITVSAGEVTIDSEMKFSNDKDFVGTLAVAQNAVLNVNKVVTLSANAPVLTTSSLPESISGFINDNKNFDVAGTVNVNQGGNLKWGYTVITGTLNVLKGGNLDMTAVLNDGTITVAEDALTTVGVEVMILNGTLSGPMGINELTASIGGAIFAMPGSDITAAKIMWDSTNAVTQAETSEVYINGELYATVYANGSVPILYVAQTADVDGVYKTGSEYVRFYTDAAMDNEFSYADARTKLIGANDAYYITMAPMTVDGTISQGTGLALYIDNVNYDQYGNSLTVGTHTVRYDVKAGYDGANATITFNGQTVENGGTITITADMVKDGFTLVASGAVPADYTGGSSSDGMGLTEILLIILVILIVVMAIMVALRLMRS